METKDQFLRCLYYGPKNDNWFNLSIIDRVNSTDCPSTYDHDICTKDVLCPTGFACVSTWFKSMNTTRPQLLYSYCMEQKHDTNCKTDCLPYMTNNNTQHCCCNSTSCNEFPIKFVEPSELKNITHVDISPNNDIPIDSHQISSGSSATTIVAFTALSFLLIIITLIIIIRWKEARSIRQGRKDILQLTELANPQSLSQTNEQKPLDIQLHELVGCGRFAKVHRAFMNKGDEVAVKIISQKDRQVYQNEVKILKSFKEKTHNNVIRFIHSQDGIDGQDSLWLVVEFCRYGSLYEFLKPDEGVRLLSWSAFYNLILGIVNGLTFLHNNNVTHCDFKSKNVLLKSNRIPCITDFSHSLLLDENFDKPCDKRQKYLQSGTPRYMAPEILECSVTFSRSSFAKIDVYSMGLVMWELLTRLIMPPYHDENGHELSLYDYYCCDIDESNEKLPPYRAPFEDYAPNQPTIEQMRKIVVEDRLTPELKSEWIESELVGRIVGCIKDTWDYDPDARVSSLCIAERLCPGISRSNTIR